MVHQDTKELCVEVLYGIRANLIRIDNMRRIGRPCTQSAVFAIEEAIYRIENWINVGMSEEKVSSIRRDGADGRAHFD